MNLEVFLMNGYGVYVWTSFLITFSACLLLFLKTQKTLKKLEKDFISETQTLTSSHLETLKQHKIVKEILVSHSRT